MTTLVRRRDFHSHAALLVGLVMVACQPAAESDPEAAPPSGDEATTAVVPTPEPSVSVDTVDVRISVTEPGCTPGKCVCSGTADRSAGLWRVGIDFDRDPEGVICLAADFDDDGVGDYVLMGGEGFFAAVMYGPDGPYAVRAVEGLGMPELYAPRAEPGTRGEPVSAGYGILVRRGGDDAYFVWNGEDFELTLLPEQTG